jgi:hypothetical protein
MVIHRIYNRFADAVDPLIKLLVGGQEHDAAGGYALLG